MKIIPFKPSPIASMGTELEFQIINPVSYALASRAKDLIRSIKQSIYSDRIKPEITQGMIEINSSVHHASSELYKDLLEIRDFLLQQGEKIDVSFSGGGTHPFQMWPVNKIFPDKRFRLLSKQYKYLSKRSTVFGQHVHIGCDSGDSALYLTHALARYVPQFIAINASSPFYQGIDTSYHSSRVNVFNAFPLSGVIPYLTTWKEFSDYFYKMRSSGIIKTMKDFYWDIRPKPEFGTVEVRVCDTPLTFKKSIILTSYIQTIAYYLLQERPIIINHDLYHLYNYNRFQASRYGFEGSFINQVDLKKTSIANDIIFTIKAIKKYANDLGNMGYLIQLLDCVLNRENDASLLRNILKEVGTLPLLVRTQCQLWKNHDS